MGICSKKYKVFKDESGDGKNNKIRFKIMDIDDIIKNKIKLILIIILYDNNINYILLS